MNLPKRSTRTSQVTGIPVVLHRSDWREYVPEVGHYAGTASELRTTSIECPYCRHLLTEETENRNKIGRIVWLAPDDDDDAQWHALVELVPKTHRLVVCRPCNQAFTVPRE